MKLFRTIGLTALMAVGILTAVLYTSCKKDNCKDRACLVGATCTDGNCRCPVGFHGVICEQEDTLDPGRRTKFVKLWTAHQTDEADSTRTSDYTSRIDYNTLTSDGVIIDANFANRYFSHPLTATVAGASISLNLQSPDGSSNASISGYGTYDILGRIVWNYTIVNTTTNRTVVYKDVWQ